MARSRMRPGPFTSTRTIRVRFPRARRAICGDPNISQAAIDWYAATGFHPTFFYEAGWSLLSFGVLYFIMRRFGRSLRMGDMALLYFIAYPLGRFWVEAFRPDAWTMGTLATAQWIGLGSIVISAILLFLRHRNWSAKKNPEESLAALSSQGV